MEETEFYSQISHSKTDVGQCINYLCPHCDKIADKVRELWMEKLMSGSQAEGVRAHHGEEGIAKGAWDRQVTMHSQPKG